MLKSCTSSTDDTTVKCRLRPAKYSCNAGLDRGAEYRCYTGVSSVELPTSVSSIHTSRHIETYMVDTNVEIAASFDPFAEAEEFSARGGAKEYVHIRIQQRNGKKSLTTVQGLRLVEGLRRVYSSYEKILKYLKKELCCNGNVVQDKELGKVIQLQGDQRKNVSHFLLNAEIVNKDQIKIHGF
ncbi:hypothetical protein HAX54_046306 [Datura stramonium]|uniref:SUI1 domain-containing protein n=1 Tax=Datura stramonium TaxID=4076 RepID=A0ABS8SRI4_DATST|nr:hypothetical protein [Datura stramonium]